jgi:uncharacterized protein (DUF1697 family)
MKTYVALLRGINVGGNNKVDMKKLKAVFASIGFQNVRTYINSGNVIFETTETGLESLIEATLHRDFGFPIRVVVRDAKNIQKLCAIIPTDWTNDTQQRTDVLFLWDHYDNKKSVNLINTTDVDTLLYVPGAIIWNVLRSDIRKSGMQKFIGSDLYKNMTARNVNTVRKLNELMKKHN